MPLELGFDHGLHMAPLCNFRENFWDNFWDNFRDNFGKNGNVSAFLQFFLPFGNKEIKSLWNWGSITAIIWRTCVGWQRPISKSIAHSLWAWLQDEKLSSQGSRSLGGSCKVELEKLLIQLFWYKFFLKHHFYHFLHFSSLLLWENFWKHDFCLDFFCDLETSNFGYLLIF